MDTIVITGANGFFASRFINFYKDKYNIIGFSHKDLDIRNEKKTLEMIKEINPRFLIHAAAISDTGLCEKNPILSEKVNVEGSINIAKACYETKTKMIFLSSDQVYNGNKEMGPYSEKEAIPNTIYGMHKFEAESHINKILNDAVILRLTWLFCPPERNLKMNSNIFINVLKALIKNESIKLPCYEFRGITYVYDLIENFNEILNIEGGIYNTGSQNNLSTYETALKILKYMGLENKKELLIKDDERFKEYHRDLRIYSKKLFSAGIKFTTTEEALNNSIKDFHLDL